MSQSIQVVVVEDNDLDALAVKRAIASGMQQRGRDCSVERFTDGDDALEALRCGRIRRPWFVVLDLDLPRMPGLRVLEALRRDRFLRSNQVAVLSGSSQAEERSRAQCIGAAAVLSKGDESMQTLVDMIESFAREQTDRAVDAARASS